MVDFSLSEEQSMLRDALQRFVADRYDVERRRSYRQGMAGFGAENWDMLAELGLFALPLPEADGGLGGGPRDVMTLMTEIGRGLVVEPVLSAILFCAPALARHGNAMQRAEWLPTLTAGTARWSLLLPDEGIGMACTPRAQLSNGRLTIEPGFALDGAGCDAFLLVAMREGEPVLVALAADTPGLVRRDVRLLDGSIAAWVEADGLAVAADRIMPLGTTGLSELAADARFAAACEMLGIMERLLGDTLDHVRTRRQFGTEIGRFQTIQHRMARLYLAVEQSRSLLLKATEEGAGRHKAIAAAKAFVGEAAIMLAHECVQFHGGMGITDELAIGHGHKRITLLSRLFGDARAARRDYLAAA
ncbi:acyl-CoA dehydrogenase family protein [Flavisphingomonas formosensis]|uniref:acyl-CoA dehydrogenase family protein n=1 Tax=Flavisphingomonas formosensis TaxID=861534 RepID=UPI0018DFB8D7|nr:acyl-CoA dehydrogenase family protein [Sphingomonas formosensis]